MTRRTFAGFVVAVESPAGSVREWRDAAGRRGRTALKHDYGYLKGAGCKGPDGDELDCYLGPHEDSGWAYVVHQLREPAYEEWDEDKLMLGFRGEAEAREAYLAHRDDGDRAYGGMTSMRLSALRAKLARRTGDGKVRHEVEMQATQSMPPDDAATDARAAAEDGRPGVAAQVAATGCGAGADADGAWTVDMRVEQRGSKWVVLPESGDRVLGEHDTEEEALAQLRAIEANKQAYTAFEAQRGPDGKVRSGVWDRVCVPGEDLKDGQSTEFTVETLSQMADNFERRGDPVPVDHNHQSNYSRLNGQPAPALAFYGALAVVQGGRVAKLSRARGCAATGSEPGLDLSRDGLWAFRSEVTEEGDRLLPNFKFLSPTFTPEGADRDGTPCGYVLAAVAATNTPWQAGTEITFASGPPVGEDVERYRRWYDQVVVIVRRRGLQEKIGSLTERDKWVEWRRGTTPEDFVNRVVTAALGTFSGGDQKIRGTPEFVEALGWARSLGSAQIQIGLKIRVGNNLSGRTVGEVEKAAIQYVAEERGMVRSFGSLARSFARPGGAARAFAGQYWQLTDEELTYIDRLYKREVGHGPATPAHKAQAVSYLVSRGYDRAEAQRAADVLSEGSSALHSAARMFAAPMTIRKAGISKGDWVRERDSGRLGRVVDVQPTAMVVRWDDKSGEDLIEVEDIPQYVYKAR